MCFFQLSKSKICTITGIASITYVLRRYLFLACNVSIKYKFKPKHNKTIIIKLRLITNSDIGKKNIQFLLIAIAAVKFKNDISVTIRNIYTYTFPFKSVILYWEKETIHKIIPITSAAISKQKFNAICIPSKPNSFSSYFITYK